MLFAVRIGLGFLSIAFLTLVADVIGIVKHVGELTQVNSSKMNKQVGFLLDYGILLTVLSFTRFQSVI